MSSVMNNKHRNYTSLGTCCHDYSRLKSEIKTTSLYQR